MSKVRVTYYDSQDRECFVGEFGSADEAKCRLRAELMGKGWSVDRADFAVQNYFVYDCVDWDGCIDLTGFMDYNEKSVRDSLAESYACNEWSSSREEAFYNGYRDARDGTADYSKYSNVAAYAEGAGYSFCAGRA